MASRNGSKSGGLRFLWIPGRKKHQHKGRIETTRAQPTYNHHATRPNESWTLGGSKGQAELLKSPDIASGAAEAATTSAVVLTTASVAVSADPTGANKDCVDPLAVHTNVADGKPPASPASDGASCSEHETALSSYGDGEEGAHNTATLLISDKQSNGATRKKKKDLDSIDRMDDDADCTDAVAYGGNGKFGAGGSTKKSKEKPEKGDEKTVTCLYYTLQCCECSIS